MTCARDDADIHRELGLWVERDRAQPDGLCSLAVVFRKPVLLGERQFEQALWRRLQALVEIDACQGEKHDCLVSPDPDDPDFSISLAGQAFFVVGLHPGANRPARRFAYAFALASTAVALDLDGNRVRTARIALGGLAYRPLRASEAEASLIGQAARPLAWRSRNLL
jgi:hypothetical protein